MSEWDMYPLANKGSAPVADPWAAFPQVRNASDVPMFDWSTPYQTHSNGQLLSTWDRLKGLATQGQTSIAHNAGQLAAGALPLGNLVPQATTPEDQANRSAGQELALGIGARPSGAGSMLSPPNFRQGSWMTPPPGQAMTGVDPVGMAKNLWQSPTFQSVLKWAGYGAAGAAGGAPVYYGLRHFLGGGE